MSSFDISNFRESAEWFLCANTPVYLYTNLKKLQEVENLSNGLSAKNLYELCRQFLEKDENIYESELAYYICLIALSFKNFSEIRSYLESLRTDKYKWANSIIMLIIGKYNSITEYKVTVKNEPKVTLSREGFEKPMTSSVVINIYAKGNKNE